MTELKTQKPRVIIIGGGFAGLNAAQYLRKADVSVLLIDKANHHLFQPLLYQVATAALATDNIASPLREILAKQANAKVILADITEINKEKKQVIAANGDTYDYDYLIVAVGSSHSYFNHPEWEEQAPGLKTLEDAVRIREKILLSYERAERCSDPEEAQKFMTFVIVGGGPTGVEMAGAIAEIARKSLVKNFRMIKPEQSKIYLIEAVDQVLPSFPKNLAERAEKDLKKLGVDVLLNTYVTDITEEGVSTKDQFIPSRNIIWAAGNSGSPLLQTLKVPLDKAQRVMVNPDLTVPGFPDVFVIGDASYSLDKHGKSLPGVAPVAIQQGRYVAKLIKNNVAVDKRPPFSYFDKGMMATIGKACAVAQVGWLSLTGYIAWVAWSLIHIAYLITFSNRVLVMMQWFLLYGFNERRIRLIVHPIKETEDPL